MTTPIEVRAWQADGTPRRNAVKLPAETFDGRVHESAMHQAVKVWLANQRQGTTLTKTRGFVSGGNQKPWRQKGTGRARQGSIRSPLWPGGGTTFGPTQREYRLGMPKKLRQLARRSALNARAREQALTVVEPLSFDAPRTRRMAELIGKMGLDGHKVLLLTSETNHNVMLSARNIPGVDVMRYQDASTYDILHADSIVVEEAALGTLETGAEVEHVAPAPRKKKAARRSDGQTVSKDEAAEGRKKKAVAAKRPSDRPTVRPSAKKPAAKAAAKKPAAKKAEKPKAAAKKPAAKKPKKKD